MTPADASGAVRAVQRLKICEQKMIVIIVNPQERQDRSVVGDIEVAVAVDAGADDAGQRVYERENNRRAN